MNIQFNKSNCCHKTDDVIVCSICGKKTKRALVIKNKGEIITACMDLGHQKDCVQIALNSIISKDTKYVMCCKVENNSKVKIKREPIGLSLRYKVLKRDGFKCVCCGKSASDVELEIDHKIPVARGGKTTYQNLQALCFECNRGKGSIH